jgi:hypothetical protein
MRLLARHQLFCSAKNDVLQLPGSLTRVRDRIPNVGAEALGARQKVLPGLSGHVCPLLGWSFSHAHRRAPLWRDGEAARGGKIVGRGLGGRGFRLGDQIRERIVRANTAYLRPGNEISKGLSGLIG